MTHQTNSPRVSSRGPARLSRPWIIWIQPFRNNTLLLMVLAPKYQHFLHWFGRWKKTIEVHVDGPIYHSSPAEELEWMEKMIEAGATWVPDDVRYMTALSLADVHEIVEDTWRPK